MESKKKGFHYAWLILISCCCLYAGSMALTQSIAGVFMLPVSEGIGATRADFALWLTVNAIATVVTLPLWGRLVQTKNTNVVLTAGALFLVLGILGFSFSTELWMFYGCAIFTGLGMATMFNIAGPTLIQNWFAPQYSGKMLGIAAAFTGVGTFIWAPMFTMIIQNMGWQTAYLINAALAAVLMLPFTIFVIKLKPEDKGLKPFGYVEEEEGASKKAAEGIDAKRVFGCVAFYAVAIGLVFTCLGMGFNSNQPGIAIEWLVPQGMDQASAALIGATMISAAAIGNIVGKILFGVLADKIGLKATFIVFVVFYVGAFVIWLLFNTTIMLIAGAFLLGTHNAIISVGFPVLARRLFGTKDFAKIWSYLSMPFTLAAGFGTSLVAYIYQASGTYTASLYLGIGLAVMAGICAFVAIAYLGKIKWDSAEVKSS